MKNAFDDPKTVQAMKEVFEELAALPKEEFDRLLKEEQENNNPTSYHPVLRPYLDTVTLLRES